jgi:predicted phage tail protein
MKVTLSADFWRHLAIGAARAAATGLVAYLGHVDWSSFGPYAGLIQLGVQLLAEGVNQMIAMEKAA